MEQLVMDEMMFHEMERRNGKYFIVWALSEMEWAILGHANTKTVAEETLTRKINQVVISGHNYGCFLIVNKNGEKV